MKNLRRRSLAAKTCAIILALLMVFSGFGLESVAHAATYEKAVGPLTTGKYVMVLDNGIAPSQFDATNWVFAENIGTDINVADTTNVLWDIEVNADKAKLKDKNGIYIAPKAANTNGILNQTYDWAIVENADGTYSFTGYESSVELASNVGFENKFRAYKSTTITGNPNSYPNDFTLYRLADATVDPVDPIDPVQPEPLTITPIENVRAGIQGTEFTVQATVISKVNAWGGQGFYIQDATAGIYVYPNGTNQNIAIGDTVTLTGTLSEFNGALQLVAPLTTVKDGTATPPVAEVVTITAIDTAKMHTLVKLENVKIQALSQVNNFGTLEFTALDESGNTMLIRIDNRSGVNYDMVAQAFKDGDTINVSGILTTFKGTYQILPFEMAHLEMVTPAPDVVVPVEYLKVGEIQGASHVSPYEGKNVNVTNVVVTAVTGNKDFYVQDLEVDGDDRTSDAIAVFNRNNLPMPNVGDVLEIEAGVSEFVGFGFADRADTHLTISQLVPTAITVTGQTTPPEPFVINGTTIPSAHIEDDGLSEFQPDLDAIDFWESKEGMVVALDDAKIIGPQKYGDIYLLPKDSTNSLNKLGGYNLTTAQNPDLVCLITAIKGRDNKDDNGLVAKSGDTLAGRVQGPVTYSYNGYKVDTQVFNNGLITSSVSQADILDGKMTADSTEIIFDEAKLTIAGYNVENFSASLDNTSDEKVEKIAKQIVNDLSQPDIITLVEMQDNDGQTMSDIVSADLSAKRLTDSIIANGGVEYTYAEVTPTANTSGGAPGGNIRVGFIYRADRVSLKELEAIGTDNPTFESTRKSLAGIFDFRGNEVLVVGNHWNSKRGDNPLFGKIQPPVFFSEVQRTEIAKVVNSYIAEKLQANPELAVIANGDFNDFEFSKPLEIFESDIMTNLVKLHDENDRFSYFYNGNNQNLDHTIVSNNILDRVTFDMVHVNANFMRIHGRASDHDPQIVQISFQDQVTYTDASGYTPGIMNVRNPETMEVIAEMDGFQFVEGKYASDNPNWLIIDFNGQEALIYRPLLADGYYKGYATGQINLRDDVMGTIIGEVQKGKFVEGVYYNEHTNWLQISKYTKKVYLFKPLLQDDPVAETKYASWDINLRESPNGKIIDSITRFSELSGTIDGVYTNWLKVNYKGTTGYVYRPLLVNEIIRETLISPGKVNVRNKASVNTGAVIGVLSEDQEISGTVYPPSEGWLVFEYLGRTAFIWRGVMNAK